MPFKLRFAARDPGAANVIFSFIEEYRRNGSCIVFDAWLRDRAISRFEEVDYCVRTFDEAVTVDELTSAWDKDPAQCLITGTSHYHPYERLLWEIARTNGCPSLAIIDAWSNLERRFDGGRPTMIGAIDEGQARELRELGYDEILISGHSWYQYLKRRQLSPAPCDWGDDSGCTKVVFISERIGLDVAEGRNEPYGFEETDSYKVLYFAALDCARKGARVKLAIKLHPYESKDYFRNKIRHLKPHKDLDVRYIGAGDGPLPWIKSSDLVVGVNSSPMIEAMILGRPVVSIQPGLSRDIMFGPVKSGFCEIYTDPIAAGDVLVQLITCERARKSLVKLQQGFSLQFDHSGQAVVDWVDSVYREYEQDRHEH